MPRADTHEAAQRGAQTADDMLRDVRDGKTDVAVDRQEDRFARTAREAKAQWNNGNAMNEE